MMMIQNNRIILFIYLFCKALTYVKIVLKSSKNKDIP